MLKVYITIFLAFVSVAGYAQKKAFTIDEWFSEQFYQYDPLNFMSDVATADGEKAMKCLVVDSDTTVALHDFRSGKEELFFSLGTTRVRNGVESFSGFRTTSHPDKYIVETNPVSIYRHSKVADHYLFSKHFSSLEKLSEKGAERCVSMSPDGSMIAYVQNNNIYIKKLRYNSTTEVTADGEVNKIINGAPDWVYEEEFSTDCSLCWSSDSKELAYIRYDESAVEEFVFPKYNWASNVKKDANILTDNRNKNLYPTEYRYKYPKAGCRNSKVSVHVYNVDSRATKEMDLQSSTDDIYVPRIMWTGEPNQLCICKLNRQQNRFDILMANSKSTVSRAVYTEKNKCYIDELQYSTLRFLPDGLGFLMLSEQDGWMHLYHYGNNGLLKRRLTEGDYEVKKIIGYDAKRKMVLYQTAEPTPRERMVKAVSLDGKQSMVFGEKHGTNDAVYFGSAEMIALKHQADCKPLTCSFTDFSGKFGRVFEQNSGLEKNLGRYEIPKKEFVQFTAADGQTKLEGWIMKPVGMNAGQRYPVVMVQYSGPNSQEVLDNYDVDWHWVLANEGYVVVCVDGRGTGSKGEAFKKCTYMHLGKLESDDQIAVAKQVGEFPYVDKSRIAIWGWSFGGFMSSLCLCRSDVFKVGIAIAPVTNWRFYDSVYTERFMRTPAENPHGYNDFSPIRLAGNLSGRLFLIHGTADDNVHYQNQMEFAEELLKAEKQFDMFTYPNQNHSIPAYRKHLFRMLIEYLNEKLID